MCVFSLSSLWEQESRQPLGIGRTRIRSYMEKGGEDAIVLQSQSSSQGCKTGKILLRTEEEI